MSAPLSNDPRLDQAAASDESLLSAHENAGGTQPDEKGHYSMMPLVILFVFSGLIFFAGTYLNKYNGLYKANAIDPTAPVVTGGPKAPAIDPVVQGKKLYEQVCTTCHMADGNGVPSIYPPLAGSEWVNGSEERVIRIVLHGLNGPVTVKGTNFPGNAQMPAVGKVAGSGYNWSDDKIAAVLTYVRQAFGNTSPAITADKVAAIHGKEGDHKAWTADELTKLP